MRQRQPAKLKTFLHRVSAGSARAGGSTRIALTGNLTSDNTCQLDRAQGDDLCSTRGGRLGEYLGQVGAAFTPRSDGRDLSHYALSAAREVPRDGYLE